METEFRMSGLEHYHRELDNIVHEIAQLADLCNLRLLQPGMVDAILRNDKSLCPEGNRLAFDKLRGLLVLAYKVIDESVTEIGAVETDRALSTALEHVENLRRLGR